MTNELRNETQQSCYFHNIRKYHDPLTKMSTVRISDLDSDILFFCRMIAAHVEFTIVKV